MLNTLECPQECISREGKIYCDVGVELEKKILTNSELQQAGSAERPQESLPARPEDYRGGMGQLLLVYPHLLMKEINIPGEIKKTSGFNFHNL